MVKVALARDPVEGAMIKGLLEDAGIPALLQPSSAKVDGSELAFGMLIRGSGAGPQEVMVEDGRAEEATTLLAEAPEAG
jgi:putative signal transducing protein